MPTWLSSLNWFLSLCFLYVIAAGTAMEPRQSVWIMSCFGSAGAALYGRQRNPILIFFYWLVGVMFAVAFVVIVDHVQPEAEAFLVGLASGAATKSWIDSFGGWAGKFLVRGGGAQNAG